jgi:predicted Zn-dependent peptidase
MIIHNLKSDTDLSGFYIIYKGSALAEHPNERGLSHLIEHLICKNNEHLEKQYYKYAINYNAITSDNYIVYYINGLEEYLSKFKIQFYAEITKRHSFTEESIEHEKKIVLEEFNNSFSEKLLGHRYTMFRKYFNYYSAIGDSDIIKKSTNNTIVDLYERQYKEPYMIVNISNKSLFQLEETANSKTKIDSHHSLNIHNVMQLRERFNYKKVECSQNDDNIVIMHIGKNLIPNIELPKTQLLNYMLCGDMQKPVFSALRNKYGFCYYANISDYCFDNQHVNVFSTETQYLNTEKINSVVANVIKNKCISKREFNMAKMHFEIQRKIQNINRFNNIRDLLYNNIFSSDNLEKITYSDIEEHFFTYYFDYIENNFFTNSYN